MADPYCEEGRNRLLTRLLFPSSTEVRNETIAGFGDPLKLIGICRCVFFHYTRKLPYVVLNFGQRICEGLNSALWEVAGQVLVRGNIKAARTLIPGLKRPTQLIQKLHQFNVLRCGHWAWNSEAPDNPALYTPTRSLWVARVEPTQGQKSHPKVVAQLDQLCRKRFHGCFRSYSFFQLPALQWLDYCKVRSSSSGPAAKYTEKRDPSCPKRHDYRDDCKYYRPSLPPYYAAIYTQWTTGAEPPKPIHSASSSCADRYSAIEADHA